MAAINIMAVDLSSLQKWRFIDIEFWGSENGQKGERNLKW